MGRNLTGRQREKYEAWRLRREPRFIFSKDAKVLVTESSRVNDECIALQLHLSDEPKDLKVTAANGEQYQLVLLRGPAAKDIDGMPEAGF